MASGTIDALRTGRPVAADRGPVSAASFRLLTAKLKSKAANGVPLDIPELQIGGSSGVNGHARDTSAANGTEVSALAALEGVPAGPAAILQQADEVPPVPLPEPVVLEAFAELTDLQQLEADDPQTVTQLSVPEDVSQPVPKLEISTSPVVPPLAVELPQFSPLSWDRPVVETHSESVSTAGEDAPDTRQSEADIEPARIDLGAPEEELHAPAVSVEAVDVIAETDLEADAEGAAAEAVEASDLAVEAVLEAPLETALEALPETVLDYIAAPEQEPGDTPAFVEAAEVAPEFPPDPDPANDLVAETEQPVASSTPVTAALPLPEVEIACEPEPETVEVAAATAPEQGLVIDHPLDQDTAGRVAESVSEPALRNAPKATSEAPPPSAMAERVVDAMMKTITTAVYGKPSASERAAFLREAAAQIEAEGDSLPETASTDAPPQPEPAPVPQAAVPAHVTPAAMPAPAEIETEEETSSGDNEPAPISETIASRMGTSSPLLKQRADDDDPFAQPAKLTLLEEPKLTETVQADVESGELALTLLDMMSGGSSSALPQEKTLAADTLLRILPRIPVKQLLTVVDRVAMMEAPSPLLVAKLIRDSRPEVVGPLLERCSHISDQDLMGAAPSADPVKLRMMARRRVLSTVLSDYLIATGETNVLLTLIRNPGAALSHEAFYKLAELASEHQALLAPLTTRADLPPPVAFELFWHVPPELRRFIFSRFLTDSETLNKILRITLATHAGDGEQTQADAKFPSKQLVDQAIESASAFKLDEAAQQLSEIGTIGKETALRILSDRDGEPIAVLLKAMGYPRTRLNEALDVLRNTEAGLLRTDRKPDELQAIFDSMSFNKARILLTYWDWFVRKAGPYAPHN